MSDPFADDADRASRFGRPIARFVGRRRSAIRRYPVLDLVYKVLVGLIGGVVIVAGILMLVLPGPGWVTIFIGFAILGSEFGWARRVLTRLRQIAARLWERWKDWRAARRARKEDRA